MVVEHGNTLTVINGAFDGASQCRQQQSCEIGDALLVDSHLYLPEEFLS